jgi:5-methylcytosine-specific restriction endonuclease McrA
MIMKKYEIKISQNICRHCYFNFNIHHIIPKSSGGKDIIDNLSLLHKICHRQLHFSYNETWKLGINKRLTMA